MFSAEDVADFERRLEAATEALEADDGPELSPDSVVSYIAARRRGELPPGDEGVTEHFGENVEAAHLDRVWEHTMRAT